MIPKITWPREINPELKDSTKRKIDKHFVTWFWIMSISDFSFVRQMRDSLCKNNLSKYELCCGLASLYMYENVFVHLISCDYSRVELMKGLKKPIHNKALLYATELLLEYSWQD